MAASDPSPYVATPTGTLQGVAAFSWDGGAWQPSGRAGPDVATPTGVLQGVAPFAWDGSAWQPSGRAQPGVAAPGGVLDGVAVYTWSGSAWTPASGTATPATPSGALRGIAAFSWDGAAWQPAAQARASVPTPYGVLDGVAMFNWGGTAWNAGAAVPSGATLDLSFLSGSLDPRITFTRASTATYFDNSGTMRTAASGAPRFDYDPVTHAARGLLIEEARTNTLFPSTIGGSWIVAGSIAQGGSVTLPDGTTSTTALLYSTDTTNAQRQAQAPSVAAASATTYTVSVYLQRSPINAHIQVNATGGVTSAGVAYFDLTNGTAVVGADLLAGQTGKSATIAPVGNGWYRASFTFTTQSGSTGLGVYVGPCVVVSSTGDNRPYTGVVGQGVYAWGVQIEQGGFATSYVPTTSAAVTRSADSCVVQPANMGWFTAPGGSWMAEFISLMPSYPGATRVLGYPVATGKAPLYITGAGLLGIFDTVGATNTGVAVATNAISKGASTWASPNVGRICLNGGAIGLGATLTSGFGDAVSVGLAFLQTGTAAQGLSGYIRRMRYWPRVLSDAEMQAVTT